MMKVQKFFGAVLLGAMFLGVAGFGAELNPNRVPANAKWLLFVDGAGFRKSKIGSAILEEKLEPHIGEVEKATGLDLNFSFGDIRSVTAFGSRVGEGGDRDAVLLMETSSDLKGDLEKLLARKAENPGLGLPIAKKSESEIDYYTIGGDLIAAPAGKGFWVLSKNLEAAFEARNVAMGVAPALGNAAFLNYPAVTNSFFFLAAAETSSANGLPAQARILQKADGLRIAVGEQGNKMVLNLALRAKDAETLGQIRDVLQGLKALAALGSVGNEDLAALSNSAEISVGADAVTVNLSLPVSRVMKKVRDDK